MNKNKLNLTLPLATTFVLMVLVVIYTSALFYRISVSNIYGLGADRVSGTSANLGNYLDTAKSVLWVTADTVDFMVSSGEPNDVILDYLTQETKNHKSQFDENYTGLYGCINGEYLDGLGWTPPEDYDLTQRDWYKIASEADGGLMIVPPYVDAQTGSLVISVCKSLSNNADVLSLDVYTNHIQDIIGSTDLNGKGYSFIVDKQGTVIAHADTSMNGTDINSSADGTALLKKLGSSENDVFETVINGKKYTVFADEVMDQWYVMIVVGNDELFKEVYAQLAVMIATSTIVFMLIALFYIFAYRKEKKSSLEAEALKVSEQQKAYEAELLRLEKAAADSANKAKGDFLAQMSHEIRTPINAVLGMNEMILRESDDENILEYSENIQTAGRTLLSLINSILDFSKIEDGKMEIIPVKFDTMSVINNLINSVSERAKSKGLEFEVKIDPGLPSGLIGDDVRITQVIVNLLTNAVKYTEHGSVTLEINCIKRLSTEAVIGVSVSDTGIGIREEDIDKLFESFSRLDETRNRNIEGTGLGMAIVTKLLALMDSRLNVKSVYGKGSVFSFELRQKVADVTPIGNALERHAEHTNRDVKEYSQYKCARVLVTDDNEMNLKVVRNLLKLFGIRPVLASSGAETIKLMRKDTFDIVFLDHMMPKMDGIETLEKLREEHLIPDSTVVIALTANAVLGAKEKYLGAGFKDYLSKPIELDSLDRVLSEYLSGKAADNSPENGASLPAEPASESDESVMEKLDSAGFSARSGFTYCMEDMDFYKEMLSDYAGSYKERMPELETALVAEDHKLYCTIVHGLKSSSKTVGADDVSALAEKLEYAARDRDIDFVRAHHGEFAELFKSRAAFLEGLLGLK